MQAIAASPSFENRLTFGKVMGKSLVSRFLTRSVENKRGKKTETAARRSDDTASYFNVAPALNDITAADNYQYCMRRRHVSSTKDVVLLASVYFERSCRNSFSPK